MSFLNGRGWGWYSSSTAEDNDRDALLASSTPPFFFCVSSWWLWIHGELLTMVDTDLDLPPPTIAILSLLLRLLPPTNTAGRCCKRVKERRLHWRNIIVAIGDDTRQDLGRNAATWYYNLMIESIKKSFDGSHRHFDAAETAECHTVLVLQTGKAKSKSKEQRPKLECHQDN